MWEPFLGSVRRLPVSEQVDKQFLKDFQAKPWGPKGGGEGTDAQAAQGLPSLPVQQTDGTSAVDTSRHGLERTSDELGDEALEEEPQNLFQRVGPAAPDLKRSAPDTVPGSGTKLQRMAAFVTKCKLLSGLGRVLLAIPFFQILT